MEGFLAALFRICVCITLPLSIPDLPPKASAKNQQSQLTNGTKDYNKKTTKYSDVPAKGEFQNNHSDELVSGQDRRVVRESRYKNTYPEIIDQGNNTPTAQ